MPDLNIVLRYIDAAVDAGIAKTTASVNRMGAAVADAAAGGERGFSGMIGRANDFATHLDAASDRTQKLNQMLGNMRNTGLGIAAAGAGGLMLANNLIEAGNSAERADSAMEAMLKKRGEGGRFQEMSDWAQQLAFNAALVDDDPIKAAAAGLQGFGVSASQVKELMPGLIGQSRLYNQDLASVAEAAGRAFGKGDVSGLTRIGITLTDEQIAKVEELKNSGASQAERQAALYNLLKDSFKQYALSMTEGLGANEIAANRFALQMDTLTDNMGKGASEAKSSFEGWLSNAIGLKDMDEEAQKGAGKWLFYGSMVTTAVGGTVSFLAQVAQVVLGLTSIAAARSAAAVAAAENAAATAVETEAIVAEGAAAGESAVSVGLLGGAMGALGAAAAIALPLLIAAAGAKFVGASIDAGFSDRLEKVATGEGPGQVGKNQQSASTVEGLLSQADDLKRRQEELAQPPDPGPWWSRWTKASRDATAEIVQQNQIEARSLKITEDALRARAAAGQVAPPPGSDAGTGGTGSTAAYVEPAINAKASAAALESEIDTATKQAEDLSDKIDNETNDRRKKELQEDLKHLQRHIKHLNDAKRDADKREAEAQKNNELRSRLADAQAQETAALREAETGAAGEVRQARDKAALDAQIKEIEGQAEAGLIGKSEKESRIDALKAEYERRDRAQDADDKLQIARVKAQAILAEARIKASTQTGQEAKTTLALGKVEADKEVRLAGIEVSKAAQLNAISANQPAALTPAQRIMQALGRTGSVYDLPRNAGNEQGGASGTVAQSTQSTLPDGRRVIQFAPIVLADPWATAAKAYGR